MTTLAEHIIVAGAKNCPPMLKKSMYDSWASLEEDGQTRPKKYSELTEAQQLQDDCDVQATNIILHGLPPDVYAHVNHQETAKDIWDKVKLLMKGTELSYQERECRLYNLFDKFASVQVKQQPQAEFPQLDSGLAVPTFQQGEDPIDCINKVMAFLSAVASRFSSSNNQLKTSSNPRNQATIQDRRVAVQQIQRRKTQSFVGTRNRGFAITSRGNYTASQPKVVKCYNCLGEGHMVRHPGIKEAPVAQQTIPQNSAFQTKDLDAYDSDCDDLSSAKAVLMANLSSYDSDVLSEAPYSNTYLNDMLNQDVEMTYSEQTHIVDFPDNEINSDSNVIPYSQYLQESQDAGIHDTNSSASNDLLVLSLVEPMNDHVANLDKENQTNKMEHDVISMIDDEETLILEEESRSKMLDKQNDPILIKQNINISPIDYSKLNKIKEDFVKSHTPVRIEAPSELPIVSLVNESLKKIKYQLASFDKVVKKRTTSNAITANKITEVQTAFNQMKASVDQCFVDKNVFEIQIKQLCIDNDRLLKQIMSQEIVHIVVNSVDILNENKSCVDECNKCLELETELLKKKDLIEKDIYDKLLKKHSVAKLLSENENLRKEREHLKSIYKDQFDSIRKTRVQSKEHCASLIAQINAKSVENSDLNAQLQEKVFAIAALKNELRKLKGKNITDTAVSKPSATIASGMFKLDIEPISHILKNNKDAHEVYLEKTIKI
ncbi:hypothetical protein Tco_0408827 [Tanacetum coccineum]